MRLEKISAPTLPLRNVQSTHFKELVVSLLSPGLDYINRMITETWPVEGMSINTSFEEVVAEQGGQKVV